MKTVSPTPPQLSPTLGNFKKHHGDWCRYFVFLLNEKQVSGIQEMGSLHMTSGNVVLNTVHSQTFGKTLLDSS